MSMKGLTNDERELIIRINAGEPDVVHIDTSIPKYRRQLERWGFKPLRTDSWGGAEFTLSINDIRPMSKRKSRKTPLSAEQKKKMAENLPGKKSKKV